MAASTCFARGTVVSLERGWGCLLLLAIGGWSGVLAANDTLAEPNPMGSQGQGGCYRSLSNVIWGFLVTLLAWTLSMWGSWKYQEVNQDFLSNFVGLGLPFLNLGQWNTFSSVFVGFGLPLLDLRFIVESSLQYVSLLWTCHKMEFPNSLPTDIHWIKFFCSSLLPWSKNRIRILMSCNIVVYVSKGSSLLERDWLWEFEMEAIDEFEAMLFGEDGGRKTQSENYTRKRFSHKGIRAFVWKEVSLEENDLKCLPKYDMLKYLRGNSGFALIALAVQTLGYIYAVAFQSVKNLRVSPLEVITLMFNMILLLKVCVYLTCNRCHRPLVLYVKRDWERAFDDVLDRNDKEKFQSQNFRMITVVIMLVIVACLSSLLIFFAIDIAKATNVKVVAPIIMILIGMMDFHGMGFLDYGIGLFEFAKPKVLYICMMIFNFLLPTLNIVAFILAIVGVVGYWESEHFNSRAELVNLSQLIRELIPFIG